MFKPEATSDVINSVQIHIHTPGKENMMKKPADVIILCLRLDDHFQNEDQQLILQLGIKAIWERFLKENSNCVDNGK